MRAVRAAGIEIRIRQSPTARAAYLSSGLVLDCCCCIGCCCGDPREKVTWLQMAAHWLRLIPKAERSPSETFEARAKTESTGQFHFAAQH